MLDLDPEQIHLWCVFFDQIQDAHLLAQYQDLLSDDERERMRRFHFAKDRHCFLLTRALVRTVLSRYAAIAPQHWSFCADAYGKPRIANDDSIAKGISFNVSHTQGLIVLGVTQEHALGIDTEHACGRPAPLDVVDRFFSPEEAAALHALPAAQRQERFFRIWTLKEAYIKARGMGLSIPLDQFGFHFRQNGVAEISIDRRLNDTPSRWRFWQCRPAPDYLLAVCAEHRGHAGQQLILKKIVPLAEEEMLACPLFN